MTTTTEDTAARPDLLDLLDRAAVRDLVDRFIVALDGHDFDDRWLATVVTDDVLFEFPLGRHEGVDGLAAHLERPMATFERTQHVTSNAVVDLDGDHAAVKGNMIAAHLQPPRDAGAGEPDPLVLLGSHADGRARQLLLIGTHFEGEARRTAAGWRLARLTFTLSWILGEPPGRAAARQRPSTDAATSPKTQGTQSVRKSSG